MSLFSFGFRKTSSETGNEPQATNKPLPTYLPEQVESGLGREEHDLVATAVQDLANPEPEPKRRKTRGKYAKYSDKQRAAIAKYASENGPEKARKQFIAQFPNLNGSTVRYFKTLYEQKMKEEAKKDHPLPVTALPTQPRGRPPLLLELDAKLIKFLQAVRRKGGVVNIHVVRATADALIKCNPAFAQQLSRFGMLRSWVQSLYRRMKFTRRAGTTSRPPVPMGIYEECRSEYLRNVNQKMKLYSIPAELVLNADQTPSSYVSVGKQTMAAHGSKSVPIAGLSDKRNITLTFVVSLAGEFLPMQVIYAGKTKQSQPRGFVFPKGFSITQNPKHWSNELETLRLIDEVINPYVVNKRKELKLPSQHKALVIWDVFKGQMTDTVKSKLTSLSIELVAVPANMTHLFQPLDLTVNGAAKKLARKEFIQYYSTAVQQQLQSGKSVEEIEVDLRMSIIKPLHAQWLVNIYTYFTSASHGREIILKGWKKAGISGLLDGTTILPPEDPFEQIYTD